MTKVFRNILICLFGAFAFLFAGFFFTGCGVNYSKISLSSSVSSLELEVGDTADVVFTIENYKKGFSNRIQVNPRSDESEAIFEVVPSGIRYLNNKQVRVTIKAIAGGHGQLHVKTLEGEKECFVDVSVTQYSYSMAARDELLYVTNDIDFVPSPAMFEFDTHTTYTKLSHYLFTSRVDFDERTFKIDTIDEANGVLIGTDSTGSELDAGIVKFDTAKLVKEDGLNKLSLFLAGQSVYDFRLLPNNFKMISIYEHSVGNNDYEDILFSFSNVYVLPSLNVKVSGGYMNEVTGEVDFKPLTSDRIVIVPNSPAGINMKQYILKLEMISAVVDTDIEFSKTTSNNFVDVDLYDEFMEKEEEDETVVHYWKIGQNSQTQNSTKLYFNIFYALAADIFDQNVNVALDYQVDIEIAPTAITVNGTPEPETFYLYNEYESDRFGWQEVLIDVVSGFNSSPNYQGIYFTFDSANIDVKYGDNDVVVSGNSRIYSDLNKSFYIRGKGDLGENDSLSTKVKINLVCDILQGENQLELDLNCVIVKGATAIQRDERYSLAERSKFVLDIDKGAMPFDKQLYADQIFQDITYRCQSSVSVVSIELDQKNPYIEVGGRFYLNLKITPITTGDASYTIYLDNGTSTIINFSVIKTLQPETTSVFLLDSGNDAVSQYSYSRTEGAGFDNVLNLEILNNSNKDTIHYGSSAYLGFEANVKVGGITFSTNDSQYVATTVTNGVYRLTTISNGNALTTFTLKGDIVEDFATEERELQIFVYASSYSLVEEFYLQNGSQKAMENIVYYGSNTKLSDKTVSLSAVAKNENSTNFNQYVFHENFAEIFDYTPAQGLLEGANGFSYALRGDEYYTKFQMEKFDKKFVYFYALRINGNAIAGGVATKVKITKYWLSEGKMQQDEKTIQITSSNGLMFFAENFTYEKKDGDTIVATYDVEFSNLYDVGFYGTFDIETLTFVNDKLVASPTTFVLEANISQRRLTRRYNARINFQEYISVENISLASNLTEINLSSKKQTHTFGVYIYPTNATNKKITAQFVASNNYKHDDTMIECNISKGEAGVYTVTVSCEKFYENNFGNIENFDDDLSGTLYIFPSEWGDSYTMVGSKNPIIIDINYCNGSLNNPYVLETAADVLEINANETMLKSHYKISTIIDMSSVQGATPIGLVKQGDEYNLVGFSGSIIGTTSQAGITNIVVSNNNFSQMANVEIDGRVEKRLFAGLFAQIGGEIVDDFGQKAKIENVSFSGKIDLTIDEDAIVSVLTSRNKGKLENVGVTVLMSNINTDKPIVYGGVAGENFGYILQDFSVYDGSKEDGMYNGLSSKNLAYYNDFVTIVTNNQAVYAGGIAGKSYGTIERKLPVVETYKLYGYSAYTAMAKIKVTGSATQDTQIFVGGAVGKVSNEQISSKIFNDNSIISNKIEGLLVGGEVSTIDLVGDVRNDAVGGIVGYVTTEGVTDGSLRDVRIIRNTSRMFVRGVYNVGGIAGFDRYSSDVRGVNYGNENRIEAVDIGSSAFNASMIIKRTNVYVYIEGAETNKNPREVYFAIGNVLSSGRIFSDKFTAISYVRRSMLGGVVSSTNSSTKDYYGDYIILETAGTCISYEFKKQDVSLGTIESDYQMKLQSSSTTEEKSLNVYLLYYFAVSGRLSGTSENLLKDEIARLNYYTPNSSFYPFSFTSQDVSISSTSNELSIDVNGNITVKNSGLAYITLSSILNVRVEQRIYIYVVNYFDKNFDYSIFFTRPSTEGVNVVDGSSVNVYGKTNTSVYLVPPYGLEKVYEEGEDGEMVVVSPLTADGESFSITKNGILTYQNVSYILSANTQLLVEANADGKSNYSVVQTNNQMVIFAKSEDADNYDGDYVGDFFTLSPSLKVEIVEDGVKYVYYYELSAKSTINIEVRYKDAAESINPKSSKIMVKTNEPYDDVIQVKSTNEDEVLFYEIFQVVDGEQELIQSRLPSIVGQYYIDSKAGEDNWTSYINTITDKDLFDITFTKNGNNFDYSCKVNDTSKRFLNRANENIYGQYKIFLYASELTEGVDAWFSIFLSEAEVNYIDITNFSNQNDLSASDEIVVPSQTGLLEIAIDPVEATFNKIEISNSAENYGRGAAEASLLFVYENVSEDGVVFVPSQNFGTYQNGKLVFTYQEMINYFDAINDTLNKQNGILNKFDSRYRKYAEYKGKVYVSYYMPSLNVDDGVRVGFDISVYYGQDNIRQDNEIKLVTKLGSYARLKFDNKRESDGVYYVARGLSYSMSMESYGFSNDQISVTVSDNSLLSISGGNGKYTLDINSGIINYGGENAPGRKVEITTYAEKVVDNVVIPYQSVMTIYIMEYVLNYVYVPGENEDIVAGMEDGVIYTAVGNPYDLEFSIRPFLEYDATNSMVGEEVEAFISDMTQNIEWSVYYDNTRTVLAEDKSFRTDFYTVKGFTFTPLKIYNPETNIYHLSARANYRVLNGTYSYSSLSTGSSQMYTEFVFDVHEQSTQDSPIPVETYEDFVKMNDNEWYILVKDITLPSVEYVAEHGGEQFTPLTASLAGLDGNGYKIYMSGTYNWADQTELGIFQNVSDDMILQNVDICLTGETVIRTEQTGFNAGLLAASNDGMITNCEVYTLDGASLSVVCSTISTGSYVAGLVGNNAGHITNSRSQLNIRANVNVAGFVGQNSGIIASSYFKGASLTNQTNATTEFTAGFAVVNSGKIYTSYVSGDPAETQKPNAYENVFYQGSQNSIVSSNNITGFVYSNSGNVEDCYSNIVLSQSGAFSSGFIFENSGEIKRCFSSSLLESNQTSNYGFMRANEIGAAKGLVEDCYYLSDENYRFRLPGDSEDVTRVGVNISIGTIVKDDNLDLESLSIEEFGNLDNFKNYVVSEGGDVHSVWFVTRTGNDLNDFNGKIFDLNRPELVAPNIEATSMRELDRIESVVDPDTGMTSVRYVYTYMAGMPALGDINNPILISDAETMEKYITRENNGAGYNYSYYRLINDIDYSEYQYNSMLYETKFMGYMEGNFMEINGLSLISSDAINYAGMFAEVGRSSLSRAKGTLMNFTIKPISVSFANANVVGGIAGRLDGGRIFNVRVETLDMNKIVVSGSNIVGGVVGMAVGDYKMQNLYSQVSAKARNVSVAEENHFNETTINFDKCSMAGSVVGVLSGTGSIYNTVTDTSVSVLANKAGLVFGVIDSGVNVEKVRLKIFSDMIINAHDYGGFVVGESIGKLSDVEVEGFGDYFTNFMSIPDYSKSIGGVVGFMSGGELSKVTMAQSIQISTSSDNRGVPYLGGVVGVVAAVATISDIDVNASLTGFSYVGGVVGGILGVVGQVRASDVSYRGALTAQGHSLASVGVGGFVGRVGDISIGDNSSFSLTSSYSYQKTKDLIVNNEKTYYLLSAEGEYIAVANPLSSNLSMYYEIVYNTNIFDVTATSTVYTYGESVSICIGAIIGENTSYGSSSVYHSNSRLIASVKAFEMSQVLQTETSRARIIETEVEEEVDGVKKKVKKSMVDISGSISTSSVTSSDCRHYCDVTFESPSSESSVDISHKLNVLMVGDAEIALGTTI